MESWGVILLAVIAACCLVQAVVQTVVLVGLVRSGQRVAKRLDDIQVQLDKEIRPLLQNLGQITRNVSDVSELAVNRAKRIDVLLAATVETLEDGVATLRRSVMGPLGRLADLTAVVRGLRRGVEVYRQLGGFEAQRRGTTRRYAEDEHLFI